MKKFFLKINEKVFYGWVVVIASLIIGLAGFGIRYSFGVFFKSIEMEFGLSRAATSGIFSAHMVGSSISTVLGGWALDRYGPRKLTCLMGVFTGLSLLLASQATAPWHLYMSYSLLLALGTGPIFPVVNSTSSQWFNRRRGLALGISGAGTAAGSFVMAPFASYLILAYGWRMAFIVMAIVAWCIMASMSMLLVRDPAELGLHPDGEEPQAGGIRSEKNTRQLGLSLKEAVGTANFWFLFLIWFLLSLSIHLMMTHFIPHAIDLGIKPMDASFIVSLMGVTSILGRIAVGRASDTIGRKVPSVASAIMQMAALMSLIWIRDLWLFYLAAVFLGISWGGLSSQVTVLIIDVFGLRSVGTIMGIIGVGWASGAAIGPALGGFVFDASHNYSIAFSIGAASMVVATILAALIKIDRRSPAL